MKRILATSADGICVNIIGKKRIENALSKIGEDGIVQFTTLELAKEKYEKYDVLLVTENIENQFRSTDTTSVFAVKNLLDEDEILRVLENVFEVSYNFA